MECVLHSMHFEPKSAHFYTEHLDTAQVNVYCQHNITATECTLYGMLVLLCTTVNMYCACNITCNAECSVLHSMHFEPKSAHTVYKRGHTTLHKKVNMYCARNITVTECTLYGMHGSRIVVHSMHFEPKSAHMYWNIHCMQHLCNRVHSIWDTFSKTQTLGHCHCNRVHSIWNAWITYSSALHAL